jgi:hypothetical protein
VVHGDGSGGDSGGGSGDDSGGSGQWIESAVINTSHALTELGIFYPQSGG